MKGIQNKALILLLLTTTCMASYGSTRRRCRDFKKEDVLEQGTRNTIYELIDKNPGLHFRKICRISLTCSTLEGDKNYSLSFQMKIKRVI